MPLACGANPWLRSPTLRGRNTLWVPLLTIGLVPPLSVGGTCHGPVVPAAPSPRRRCARAQCTLLLTTGMAPSFSVSGACQWSRLCRSVTDARIPVNRMKQKHRSCVPDSMSCKWFYVNFSMVYVYMYRSVDVYMYIYIYIYREIVILVGCS